MNIDLSRRGFLRLAGAGVAATSLGAMGFGEAEALQAGMEAKSAQFREQGGQVYHAE